MNRRIIYVVLDGLGDHPAAELGGRTPLEAAARPNLQRLVTRGQTGLLDAIAPGVAPESDAAVISILGYDVNEFYTGRGPLESYGAGMSVPDGCLAWRCNFGTVDADRNIIDRRVGRNLSDAEARELAQAVQREVTLDGAEFQFEHTLGHRACLVITVAGQQLSGQVDNCDPAYQRHGAFSIALADPGSRVVDARALDGSPAAALGARLTNDFMQRSYEVLENHPVNRRRREAGKMPGNFILARDAGDRLPRLPAFRERFGLRFGSLVEMPVEIGIASLTGMGMVSVGSTLENPQAGFRAWAAATAKAITEYDGLYVHLKGPDQFGHDGDPRGKSRNIELIDEHYFGPLLEAIDLDGCVIAVTADHSTPCDMKAHSGDPVPVLVSCSAIEPDGSPDYGETAARSGRLGRLLGPELMPLLVELAGPA